MRAFVWDWVVAGVVEEGAYNKWKRVYIFKPLYLMNIHVIVFIFEAYLRGTAFIFKRNRGGGYSCFRLRIQLGRSTFLLNLILQILLTNMTTKLLIVVTV